ncbi:MAG: SRPBCC family protein [Candidatus Kariarchaeaceae archaeon]
MRSKTVELEVKATKEKIWGILSDFGNMGNWIPTHADFSISDPDKLGVGTKYSLNVYTRSEYSYTKQKNSYEIVSWDKYHRMTSNLTEGLGIMKNFQTEWLLKSSGNSTWVSFTVRYKLRFGFFGSILNKIIIGGIFRKEIGKTISNLKHFAETGEKVVKPSWMPNDQSIEQDHMQTSTYNQKSDMFRSKASTANQQCKKCYGGLNEEGRCDQCDKKW